MGRRLNLLDLFWVVLFILVAAAVWWRARPASVVTELTRQIAALDHAAAAKETIDLLPAPTTPQEAGEMLAAFDRYRAADRAAGWDAFRGWVALRGRPETIAAGRRAWNEYDGAATSLRAFLAAQAASAGPSQPTMELKETDEYMNRLNRLHAAEEQLQEWAAGLSQADFK